MNARNCCLSNSTSARDSAPKGTLVWDGWLRLFHWALAGAVAMCVYTGLFGGFEAMDWHQWGGFTVLALVLFRLLGASPAPRRRALVIFSGGLGRC